MGCLQVKHEWSYKSKHRVMEQAKIDLVDFANWGKTSFSLDVLEQIQEDLIRLEELDK